MPELINFAAADKIGVVAFCVLIVVALFREWIVTGPSHRRELADKDRQLAEKDKALTALMEVGRTVEAVLESVRDLAEKREP